MPFGCQLRHRRRRHRKSRDNDRHIDEVKTPSVASQGDTEYAREVTRSVESVASRERVQLITLNNRYSAREALRNADLLIRERVDLVLEFQTYERVASVIASKFLAANTPVIAIEVPHPGATYFGADNYKAGLIGGKALGRWARENWNGQVDQLVLISLPIAP